jgi:tetratricopeptide (TPR) repeat protein
LNPYASRGRFHYDQGRYVEAIAEFTRELAESPDDANIHAMIGISFSRLGNHKQAIENANKAIALEPDYDFGYYALALAQLEADRPKKAEAAIRRALEIDPDDASNHGVLASSLGHQGRWKAALEAAEAGLAIDPDDTFCAQIRAHALSLAGKKQEAVAAAHEHISDDPDSPHAHATLGWVYLRKGDHKAAEQHFAEALRLDPSEGLAREGLLESLRAKFPLYRWMIQFGAWQAQFSKAGQWVIIIAVLLLPRIIRAIARANPGLQPVLIPVAISISFLIWFTWIGEPLTNIVLLAHPLGRLALERHVRFETAVIATYLCAGVALLLLGIAFGPAFFFAGGSLCVGLVLMAFACRLESVRWLRHLLFGSVAAISAIVAVVALATKFI